MKKILITGSDGLIGSNLSKYLLNKKYYVIGIDDQSRYGNIVREHHNLDNFKFIKDSILNIDLSQIMSGVDTVIHCAYHAGGINYWNHNEDEYYKKNRDLSQKVIQFLEKESKIKKVIWFSSSQVYENESVFPTPELLVNDLKPSSGYAREKLDSEKQIVKSNISKKTIIIRPFNVIGKEEIYKNNQRGHVVIDIAKKIVNSQGTHPIEIQGDGNQTRTFTSVDDLVQAINLIREKINHGFYNICGTQELSMLELSKIMWSLTYDAEPNIKCIGDPIERDVKRRIGSIEKLKKDIQWHPKNDLQKHFLEIINEIKK